MELRAENLACLRGGRRVFSGLNLSLKSGEIALLHGPNGAGKSTLLRALAGLLPLSSGEITLDGRDDPDFLAENLAYAGHLDAIKPQLTVAENLNFWAHLFDGDTDAALTRFNLTEISDRAAHTCSAGQKRRLGLARLMVSGRKVWLLDEPTVSLDTATVQLFGEVIQEHADHGGLTLIATHIDLGLQNCTARHMDGMQVQTEIRPPEDDPFLNGDWS